MMYEMTLRDGGGTFATNGEPIAPLNGYSVGIYNGTFDRVWDTDYEGFYRAVARVREAYPYSLVGTYAHDGIIEVDPVAYIINRKTALALARSTGQHSVYEFETGSVVNA